MPRITISYRRDDSLDITGRIFDRLATHFGRKSVFRDIDNIPPGVDFRRHIDLVLGESDLILAVVGPRWIGSRAGQSRLSNEADPVRLEIETALRKDKPLIPVLVSRAAMPRPDQLPESLHDFAYRNAVRLDAGQDFDVHISRLIRAMSRILGASDDDERTGIKSIAPVVEAIPFVDDDGSAVPSPEPDSNLIAELEALRDANRTLEAKLAEAIAVHRGVEEKAEEISNIPLIPEGKNLKRKVNEFTSGTKMTTNEPTKFVTAFVFFALVGIVIVVIAWTLFRTLS